jgi:hypothetical protein
MGKDFRFNKRDIEGEDSSLFYKHESTQRKQKAQSKRKDKLRKDH